jgi:RNA polymerase sigma-70 factor (ECF subfamily)
MGARTLLDRKVIDECYRRSKADHWGISAEAFESALAASADRAFADRIPSSRELEHYVAGLHLEDLALACACAEGLERAWDHFVLEYRPVLYRAADATGQSMRGREVADSLYAELFGLRLREGQRHSHLRYYHGRSSLSTWLRAVFSQRYVDALRDSSRLTVLPDEESGQPLMPAAPTSAAPPLRALTLLQSIIAAVIATLGVRDRLRLRYYYAQDLTLAQIGRLLGEHEATVSRHLSRTRTAIRKEVETRLQRDHRFTEAEVRECFAAAVADSGPMDLAQLLGPESDVAEVRKEVVSDRST